MKLVRNLVLSVCVVAAIGYGAESESPIQPSFGGQGRFRFERSDNTDYRSVRSAFLYRFRPQLKLSNGTNFSLFFQPQFSKAFGKPEYVGAELSGNTFQPTSGTTYNSALGVYQANIAYQPTETLEIIIGRQLISYGNEVVLSSLDWDNVSRSFDAIKTRYSHPLGSIDVFYSKLFDGNVTAVAQTDSDRDLFGLYSTSNLGEGLSATDLYLLYRKGDVDGSNPELMVIGARVQSRLGSLDYRAEITKQFGSQLFSDSSGAYQWDLEVGWNFQASVKSRVAIEAFQAGATFDQLYPLAHKYLGIADVFGRKNIQGGSVHLSAQPWEKLSAQVDLHNFMRTSVSAPAYKLNGADALGDGTGEGRQVGSELDVILSYSISKEITVSFGGGVLFPGEYLEAQFGERRPTFCYTQLVAQLY